MNPVMNFVFFQTVRQYSGTASSFSKHAGRLRELSWQNNEHQSGPQQCQGVAGHRHHWKGVSLSGASLGNCANFFAVAN